MVERRLKLQSRPAGVLQRFAQQAQASFGIDGRSALFDLLLIDQNLAGKNHRLGFLAGLCKTPFHQKKIEPDFSWPLTAHATRSLTSGE